MALKTSFEFSLLQMLTTLWSSLKHVNNYYNSHKVSNYKSFHKEKILAINAINGAIKMLIELDLRWSLEVVMSTF